MIPGLRDELAEYLGRHPDDAARLTRLHAQLDGTADWSSRSNMEGHVVSSIITLDPTRRRALLIHHLAYGVWIPPGGHYEAPGTAYQSARRERTEETGLSKARPVGGSAFLLDIDTHPIPARASKGEGPHWHHDFMYLDLCDEAFEPRIQIEEVAGSEWRDLDDIAATPGRMARLAERIRQLPSSLLA